MTGGWSGIGSGSYGSLDKELQINGNGVLPIQTTTRSKPPKMLKEKERWFHWLCKFACRKKVGMLLLSIVSATVFVWVLYVGKVGEDSQSGDHINIVLNNGSSFVNSLRVSPTNREQNNSADIRTSIITRTFENSALPPPPPQYFMGYTLPPGHLCNNFALPPPPADKKRTGPRPCPVCYLPVEEAIPLMPKVQSFSPVLKKLTYIYEEKLNRETEFGGSDFGGYPSLRQRSDSYDIRESMNVHCGFAKGIKPGHGTGFDMGDSDLLEMEQCRGVVVASAIFGAFDMIQQPRNISEYSKKTVCFFMFVDEETEAYLKNNSKLDRNKRVGLWRVVVVYNLPYADGRRNGKIPKLLVHRIFPNARYSLWIDGKLELVVDPLQVLERFLWRKNTTFAISRHYKRFDVFIEAEANKAAAKYDNASIDFQIDFYKKEGLTPYSEAKLPITSDVPEGCVIIREHVPISNLAACLWFNEVDRFTSRDQISFSTVRDKIRAKINWTIDMFLDCERRNFVDQKYHRDVLEHLRAPAILPPPLPVLVNASPTKFSAETSPERAAPPPPPPPGRKLPRRARDRKSGSRRHRKIVIGAGDTDSS